MAVLERSKYLVQGRTLHTEDPQKSFSHSAIISELMEYTALDRHDKIAKSIPNRLMRHDKTA